MKFSIIIPCYNVVEYLEKCVDSVLAQICTDWECLLIDDGSTDGKTGKLCDEIAAAHPAVIRVIHQENGGLGAARNTGVSAAEGDYLLFIDSDDYISPDMLQDLSEQIDRTHCDIYSFGFTVDHMGNTDEIIMDNLPQDRLFTLAEYPRLLLSTPSACARVYRREFFVNSGIRFPGKVWFEDIRTTTKFFAEAKSIAFVPKPYYYYVVRDNSITHNSKADKNIDIISAFEDILTFYRGHGLFDTYKNELCRLAIDHVYIAASVRVLRIDPHHSLLGEFRSYMQKEFPEYQKNPYLAELNKLHKLIFILLEKRMYGVIKLLFKLKER